MQNSSHDDSNMSPTSGLQDWTCCGANCRDPPTDSSHDVHSLSSGCHLIKLRMSPKQQRAVRMQDYPSSFSSVPRNMPELSPSTSDIETSLNETTSRDQSTTHPKGFRESTLGITSLNKFHRGSQHEEDASKESTEPFVEHDMTAELFLTTAGSNSAEVLRKKISSREDVQYETVNGEVTNPSSTNIPGYSYMRDDEGELYIDLSKELAMIGARSPPHTSVGSAENSNSPQSSAQGLCSVSAYSEEYPLPSNTYSNTFACVKRGAAGSQRKFKLEDNTYDQATAGHGDNTTLHFDRSVSYTAGDTQRKFLPSTNRGHLEPGVAPYYAESPERSLDGEDSESSVSSTDSDLASLMGSVEQARRRIQAYEESEKKLEQVAFAGDRSSLRGGIGMAFSALATTELTHDSIKPLAENVGGYKEKGNNQRSEYLSDVKDVRVAEDSPNKTELTGLRFAKKRDSLQRIAKSVSQIVLQAPKNEDDGRFHSEKASSGAYQTDPKDGLGSVPQMRCVAVEIQRNAELSATVIELREQLECFQSEMTKMRSHASVAREIISRVRRWREECHNAEDKSKDTTIDSGSKALKCLEDIESFASDVKTSSWVDQRESKLVLIEKELEETKRDRQRLEIQGEMLKNEVAFLKSMNEKLKARHDDDHTRAIETLKSHIEKQIESGTAVAAERDALRRELDKTRSHFAQQLAETEAMYATSEHELGALKHVTELKHQEQQAVIKRLEEENQQLREQKEAAEAQLQSSLKAERLLELERQEFQKRKDRLDAQHGALQQSLEDIRKRVAVTRNAADSHSALFSEATLARGSSQAAHEVCRVGLHSTHDKPGDSGRYSNNYTALCSVSDSERDVALPSSSTMQLHLDNYTVNSKADPSLHTSRAAFLQEYALGSTLPSSDKGDKGGVQGEEKLLKGSAQLQHSVKHKSVDSGLELGDIDIPPPAVLKTQGPMLTLYHETQEAPSEQARNALYQQRTVKESTNDGNHTYTRCASYVGKKLKNEGAGEDGLHTKRTIVIEGGHQLTDLQFDSPGVSKTDDDEHVNGSRRKYVEPEEIILAKCHLSKKNVENVEDAFRREILRVIQANELLKRANERAEQENEELQRAPGCHFAEDSLKGLPTPNRTLNTKATVHIGSRRCDPFTGSGAGSGGNSIVYHSTAITLKVDVVFLKLMVEILEGRRSPLDLKPFVPKMKIKLDEARVMDMMACSAHDAFMPKGLLRSIVDQFRTGEKRDDVGLHRIVPLLSNDPVASAFLHGVIWGITTFAVCVDTRRDGVFKLKNAKDCFEHKEASLDKDDVEHTTLSACNASRSSAIGAGERLHLSSSRKEYKEVTSYFTTESDTVECGTKLCRIPQPVIYMGTSGRANENDSEATDGKGVHVRLPECQPSIPPESQLSASSPKTMDSAVQCSYSPIRQKEDFESSSSGPSRCASGSTETPDTWRVLTLPADVNTEPHPSDKQPGSVLLVGASKKENQMPHFPMERGIYSPNSGSIGEEQARVKGGTTGCAQGYECYGSTTIPENHGNNQNTLACKDPDISVLGKTTGQARNQQYGIAANSFLLPSISTSPKHFHRQDVKETESSFKLKFMQQRNGLVPLQNERESSSQLAPPTFPPNTPCHGVKGSSTFTLNRLTADSPRLGLATCRRCEACMALVTHRSIEAECCPYTVSARNSPKREDKETLISHHFSAPSNDRRFQEPVHRVQRRISYEHSAYDVKFDMENVAIQGGAMVFECKQTDRKPLPVTPELNGTVLYINEKGGTPRVATSNATLQRRVRRSSCVNPLTKNTSQEHRTEMSPNIAVFARKESVLNEPVVAADLSTKPEGQSIKATMGINIIQQTPLTFSPSQGTKNQRKNVLCGMDKQMEKQTPGRVAASPSFDEHTRSRSKRRGTALCSPESSALFSSQNSYDDSPGCKSQNEVTREKQHVARSATPFRLHRASSGMHSANRALIRAASAPRTTAAPAKPPWDSSPAPRVNGPRVPLWAILRK